MHVYSCGQFYKTNKDTKKRIYESFKPNDNFIVSLEQRSGKNSLGFTDSENQKRVLAQMKNLL